MLKTKCQSEVSVLPQPCGPRLSSENKGGGGGGGGGRGPHSPPICNNIPTSLPGYLKP